MPRKYNPLKTLPILFYCIISTSGCMQTELTPSISPSSALQRLENLNRKEVEVSIGFENDSTSYGYQYLLALPYSSIKIANLEELFATKLRLSCAVKGSRLRVTQSAAIMISLNDPKINAYDFLFTRWIVSTVSISIDGFKGSPLKLSQRKTRFLPFAFKPQLERVFEEALFELANDSAKVMC